MTPQVNTYHCLCTSLVLASTHTLSSLPRRQSPALDKAIILPLPSSNPFSKSSGGVNSQGVSQEANNANLGYTILLSLTPDTHPTSIRREDGFEKRNLYRCGRCRLVIGYSLDDSHFSTNVAADADAGGPESIEVLYILPGGLMSSEAMVEGKKIEEAEVELGGGGDPVGVWE